MPDRRTPEPDSECFGMNRGGPQRIVIEFVQEVEKKDGDNAAIRRGF